MKFSNNNEWTETLEEAFFDYCVEQAFQNSTFLEMYTGRDLHVGDIVMTMSADPDNKKNSKMTAPHRMYVYAVSNGDPGQRKYSGIQLSSKVDRSNAVGGFSKNIFIDDFGTILKNGYPMKKAVTMKVGDTYSFTDADMDERGVYKGSTVPEFVNFVNRILVMNSKGEDLSNVKWENGKGVGIH